MQCSKGREKIGFWEGGTNSELCEARLCSAAGAASGWGHQWCLGLGRLVLEIELAGPAQTWEGESPEGQGST